MRILGVILLFVSVVVRGDPIPPSELSQRVFGTNKYESDDLALHRFNVRPDFKGIRVNIGPGANQPLGSNKFALHENRYFFLNSNRDSLLQNFNIRKIFEKKKDVVFTKYQEKGSRSAFEISMDKSGLFATIVITCTGFTDLSGLNKAQQYDYYRFQIQLSKCLINDKTVLIENSWITLDAVQFDKVANKSAMVLRALHFNEPKQIEGRSFTQSQVTDLVLGVEDELVLSLLYKLGYRLNKSYLWKHQL